MPFINTKSFLDGLVAKLSGLTFPAGSDPWAETPVFQAVRLYDIPQLEEALKDLLEFSERLCLIVPREDRFEPATKGHSMEVSKTSNVLLIITDRDYAPGKASYFGGPDHPGVTHIKDLVIEELIGETLDLPHVLLTPEDGESIRVASSADKLQEGREGYRQFFSTPMGTVKRTILRGRSLNR